MKDEIVNNAEETTKLNVEEQIKDDFNKNVTLKIEDNYKTIENNESFETNTNTNENHK